MRMVEWPTWVPGVSLPIELVPGPHVTLGGEFAICALLHGHPAAGLEIQVHHRDEDTGAVRLAARVRTMTMAGPCAPSMRRDSGG